MARFSSMIDMAKDTAEVKDEVARITSPPDVSKVTVPVYPYGLCLAFDDDTLKKLGLDWAEPGEMPSTGDMIHLVGMAKVTSVSDREEERSDGTKERCRRVELQITHLAVENENDEGEEAEARRNRFYGDGKAA